MRPRGFGILCASLTACALASSAGCRGARLQQPERTAASKSPPAVAGALEQTTPALSRASESDPARAEIQTVSDSHVVRERDESAGAGTRSSDAASTAAFSIDLDQAIYTSMQQHPVVAAELENIARARANCVTAGTAPNPEMFADIQMLPLTRPFTPTRQGGPPQQDVIVSYPIDWFLFGKRAAAVASAQRAIHVSEAEFQTRLQSQVLDVANAFFDVVAIEEMVDMADVTSAKLHELDEHLKADFPEASRRRKMTLAILKAEQEQRTLHAELTSARAVLRSEIGLADETLVVEADWDLDRPLPPLELTEAEAFALAELSRPDLNAARWRVSQAEAVRTFEQRAARSQIAPSLGYTRQYQDSIGYPDANSWSAAVTMTVPLFDRNQGGILAAEAAQRQSHRQYEALRLEAQAEVVESVAELNATRNNAHAVVEENLRLAEEIFEEAIESFQNKEATIEDVLSAVEDWKASRRLSVSSRVEYWKALFRFYAATGQQGLVPTAASPAESPAPR